MASGQTDVQGTKTTTPIQQSMPNTPPGYDYSLREVSSVLLGVTALALFWNFNGLATLSSAGAIRVLVSGDGPFWRMKNIPWGLLSIISFLFSVASYSLSGTAEAIESNDERLSSIVKGKLLGWMKYFQLFCLLTMVLVTAYTSKFKENGTRINKLQPEKQM